MNKNCEYTDLIGRVLIGAIFLFAGYGKIVGFSGTKAYMNSSALSVFGSSIVTLLLVLTIILEVAGGLMLIVGYRTKCISYVLAGFVVLATALFHMGAGQSMLMTKNVMIIGGLLVLAANGAGRLSLDAKCGTYECKECDEKCEVKEEKAVAKKSSNKRH